MNCFQPREDCQCGADESEGVVRETRVEPVRVADGEEKTMEEEVGEEVLGEEDFDIMRECWGRG